MTTLYRVARLRYWTSWVRGRLQYVARRELASRLFAVSFLPGARPTSEGDENEGRMAANDAPQDRLDGGALNGAISQAIVRLIAESTGRGPTKARTTIDRDLIVVLLQNTLTPGERYLADSDRTDQVLDMRRAYQEAMRSDCVAAVEDLTGRTVVAFMSANHVEPDLAAEVFVLKPESVASPETTTATT
jgi:uncharacterized protein YbcI